MLCQAKSNPHRQRGPFDLFRRCPGTYLHEVQPRDVAFQLPWIVQSELKLGSSASNRREAIQVVHAPAVVSVKHDLATRKSLDHIPQHTTDLIVREVRKDPLRRDDGGPIFRHLGQPVRFQDRRLTEVAPCPLREKVVVATRSLPESRSPTNRPPPKDRPETRGCRDHIRHAARSALGVRR